MTAVSGRYGRLRYVDGQYRNHRLDGVNISPVFCLPCAVGVLVGVGHGSATVVKTEILSTTRKRGGQYVATSISNSGHYAWIQPVRREGVSHTGDSGSTVRRHSPPIHNDIDGCGCVNLAKVGDIYIVRLHGVAAFTEIGRNGHGGLRCVLLGRQRPIGGVSIDHPVQCVSIIVDGIVHSGGHRNFTAGAKVFRRPTE